MKKIFTTVMCVLMVCLTIASAQSTIYGEQMKLDDLFSVTTHYGLFVLAMYELVIRFFPTVKSYSLLAEIIGLLNYLVPDNNLKGGTHAPLIQSITIRDVKIGDSVKTHSGEVVKVLDVASDGSIAVQDPIRGEMTSIKIDDILEIIKKGYVLVDTVKAIISFFVKLLKKK